MSIIERIFEWIEANMDAISFIVSIMYFAAVALTTPIIACLLIVGFLILYGPDGKHQKWTEFVSVFAIISFTVKIFISTVTYIIAKMCSIMY